MEEVIGNKRCPNPMLGESEIEIRPILYRRRFREALTPELENRKNVAVQRLTNSKSS